MSSNAKKIGKNIFFGIGSQIVIAIIGLLIPRLFVSSYGSETNGFLSSLNQIFTYIVLLEAGVGTATLQALYKPIATDDKEKINGILSASAQFYTRTGWCYLGCVGLLAVIYPLAIKSALPVWEQVAVILIIGSGNSLGFFLHAKFRMLLCADGKTYIYTNASTLVQLGTSLTKVVLILLGMNIVFIQLGHLLLQIGLSLYITLYTKKHYPWLNLKAKPDKQAISQKNSVLVHEVSQMIFNHTDVLLLTVFTNLTVVSIYTVYNMIVDIISTLIGNIHNGFAFRLGQIYNTDKERYKGTYDAYETCYMALSVALYAMTFIFLLPFMRLYMEGVEDANYLDNLLPIFFVSIKLLVSSRALAGATTVYAGHFKKTRWRSVLESIINLSVSIAAILFLRQYNIIWGMYGVLIGTIAALLYRANDMIIYTARHIIGVSPWKTYQKWIVDLAAFAAVYGLSKLVPIQASGYVELVLYAVGYSIATFAVVGLLNLIFFRKHLLSAFSYIHSTLCGKRRKRSSVISSQLTESEKKKEYRD